MSETSFFGRHLFLSVPPFQGLTHIHLFPTHPPSSSHPPRSPRSHWPGGGYITSTLMHANVAASFTTPALGSRFLLIDDAGAERETGEVALCPPTIGLSTRLLRPDHHKIYYDDMPAGPQGELLRRHGDEIEARCGVR